MAKFDLLIPHLIRWEAGVMLRKEESTEQLFERARKNGYSNRASDKGGHTMIGVTLKTYRNYCSAAELPEPDVAALEAIPLSHWRDIAKVMFWDLCQADLIRSQSVAEMLVDWAYNAGPRNAIKGVQRVVNTIEDGIIGNQTLTAINSRDSRELFNRIKEARLSYYDRLVYRDPSQAEYLDGWRNRTDNLTYKG